MLEVIQIQYNKWYHPNLPKLEEFVKQYQKLYEDADRLFDEFNVCGIQNGSCRTGDFCCHGCKYLTEEGCTTNSIWCKLWVCHKAGRHMEYSKLFQKLRDELREEVGALCHWHSGRYNMAQHVLNFYGPTEYERWRTTQTCTTNASST